MAEEADLLEMMASAIQRVPASLDGGAIVLADADALAMADEAYKELVHAASFYDLVELAKAILSHHYPASIFPARRTGEAGPDFIRELRDLTKALSAFRAGCSKEGQ